MVAGWPLWYTLFHKVTNYSQPHEMWTLISERSCKKNPTAWFAEDMAEYNVFQWRSHRIEKSISFSCVWLQTHCFPFRLMPSVSYQSKTRQINARLKSEGVRNRSGFTNGMEKYCRVQEDTTSLFIKKLVFIIRRVSFNLTHKFPIDDVAIANQDTKRLNDT